MTNMDGTPHYNRQFGLGVSDTLEESHVVRFYHGVRDHK